MSDTTDIKCNCIHCEGGIALAANQFIESFLTKAKVWGQEITCPHCQRVTRLYTANTTGKGSSTISRTGTTGREAIETTLDAIGNVFFIAGIIGAAICGLFLLASFNNSSYGEDQSAERIGLGVSAVVFIAQGIIIQTLFRAAAEVIRLLRKLIVKT